MFRVEDREEEEAAPCWAELLPWPPPVAVCQQVISKGGEHGGNLGTFRPIQTPASTHCSHHLGGELVRPAITVHCAAQPGLSGWGLIRGGHQHTTSFFSRPQSEIEEENICFIATKKSNAKTGKVTFE